MAATYTRRRFLSQIGAAAATMALAPRVLAEGPKKDRLNVLLITADDMDFDSPGFTGCKLPGITPNLDAFAKQGIYFQQAHVTSAVCQPSRSAIMTGRYPHRNGAMGFQKINSE